MILAHDVLLQTILLSKYLIVLTWSLVLCLLGRWWWLEFWLYCIIRSESTGACLHRLWELLTCWAFTMKCWHILVPSRCFSRVCWLIKAKRFLFLGAIKRIRSSFLLERTRCAIWRISSLHWLKSTFLSVALCTLWVFLLRASNSSQFRIRRRLTLTWARPWVWLGIVSTT